MFKTELSFVNTITHSIQNRNGCFSKKNKEEEILVKKELCLGYGIADIVIAKYHKEQNIQRTYSLNLFDISLLRLIKNKKEIDIDKIFNITKSQKQKVKTSLKKLLGDKIIEIKKEKYYSYNNYNPILTRSIAIEAKLKNWKRALNQAYRYKWFAEKSFVFLPKENTMPAYKNIQIFKKMNIGLGTLSESKELDILFDPKKERPYSEDMSMFLNECLLINLSLTLKKIPKMKDNYLN